MSVSSSVKHSGRYAFRHAAGDSSTITRRYPDNSGVRHAVARLFFYFDTLPASGETWLARVQTKGISGGGVGAIIYYNGAAGRLQARIAGDPVVSGPAIEAERWYRLDYYFNGSTSPGVLDWAVDGVAQVPVAKAYTLSDLDYFAFGNPSSTMPAGTVFRTDDVALSEKPADYPLGEGRVLPLWPDGMGSHAGESNFRNDDNSAINSASWQRIDETPMDVGTDAIKQVTADTANYIEVTLSDIASTPGHIAAVRGWASLRRIGSTGGYGATKIIDGSMETIIQSGQTPESFTVYSAMVSPLANRWSGSAIDGLRARIGFSSTATPAWHSLLLEVATQPVPAGQTFGPGPGIHATNPSDFFADPVNSATGAFTMTVTDVSLPGIGLPFMFTRSYTSADPTKGPLGIGWTHSFAPSLSPLSNGNIVLRGEDGQQVKYTLQPDGSYRAAPGGRSTLRSVAGGYELTRHDQVVYSFDPDGRLTALIDRNGNALTLAYDAQGKLATVTDTAGRAISFAHNAAERLIGVALPDGRSVSYGYTGGLLTSATDIRGGTTTYAYDAEGRLSELVDPNGHTVIRNVYGASGRVSAQTDPLGNTNTFSWDQATETATMTDARGNQWQDDYAGNVLQRRVDPLGNTSVISHDDDLNRTAVTDPRGNATTMTYDPRGNLLTRTVPPPLSYEESFTYDAQNNHLTATDRRGNTTTYEYDASGNLIQVTEPGGVVTAFGRDPAGTGLLASVTDPRGNTTAFDHNSSGNLTQITSSLGAVTTMGYDAAGRMTELVEPRGNEPGAAPADFRWTFAYDAAGNLLTETDPLGNATSRTYDPASNLTSVTDAKARTTSYGYNAANELTSVTAPDGTVTSYAYGETGSLVNRTDAKGHTTTYGYDEANRLTEVTDPVGSVWTYAYDPAGNLIEVTDANGNSTPTLGDGIISYAFDELNQLVAVDYSDTTPDVAYSYDEAGKLIEMADGAGVETYAYDELGRLESVTRDGSSFAYEYDEASNLTRRTYPDGIVTDLSYNDDGLLEEVTSGPQVTTYARDAAGHITEVALPGGTTERRSYDEAGRIIEVRHERGSTLLSRFTYSYDGVGNPTVIQRPSGTTKYAYDDLDRLTEACRSSNCTLPTADVIRFSYDAVGNRLSESGPAGEITYTYDAADRILTRQGTLNSRTYSHDANGNLIQAGNRTFTWNLAGRVTSTSEGGQTATFSYDGAGKRVSATRGAQTSAYAWDTSAPLPEVIRESTGSGGLIRRYTYGADLISLTDPSGTYAYHHDALGSVVNLTDSSGAVVASYDYEPFGEETSSPVPSLPGVTPQSPANPMRFTGEYRDPEGFYHLRARQYDPELGRFLSTDPLPAPLTHPYVSAYAYVNNRPGVFVDPGGLRGERPIGWEDCPWPKQLPVVGDPYCEGFLSMSPSWQGLWGATVKAGPPALAVAVGGKACVMLFEICAALSIKVALHRPHHNFPGQGARWHIFLNWWLRGVPGSDHVKQFPLPWGKK